MDKGEAIQKLIESGALPTPEAIKEIIGRESTPTSEHAQQATTNMQKEAPIAPKDFLPSVEIIACADIPPKKYEVRDFVSYFRNRYSYFKELLSNRPELSGATSIIRLQQGEKATIIATIHEIKKLPTGTLRLVLEDLTGQIPAIISVKNAALLPKISHITPDEILGFKGSVGKNIFFVDDIVWPDIPYKQISKTPDKVYVACLPDLHVGSKMFLEKDFPKFTKWLRGEYGNEKQREMGRKTKYIIVCGDIVDSVGVYPTQEKELAIKDIYKQYETVAKLLAEVPSDRQIIITPGNHDGSRICEPQPALYKDIAEPLYKLPNTILIPNPSLIRLHKSANCKGVELLVYHGYSFDYFVDSIEGLRLAGGYDAADKIWEFLLKRRHLSPTYGATLALPAEQDPLLIKHIPDIVMSGHIHKAKIGRYRGVLIISGGCWQATTTFQQRMGHHPDPKVVPLINLQTGTAKLLRFK